MGSLLEIIPAEWHDPHYHSAVVDFLTKYPAFDRHLLKYVYLDWCSVVGAEPTAADIEQIMRGI